MRKTRKTNKKKDAIAEGAVAEGAVAVIDTDKIYGEIAVTPTHNTRAVKLTAIFTKLPPGKHGFHIHKAGDMRGDSCKGLCEHYDVGNHTHGGAPSRTCKNRHTGDLGNIQMRGKTCKKTYIIPNTSVKELWGRSIIVHEDEDDLGKGTFEDSKTTGHSGKRIGCAIFGRM
jgi:Cu-Zn family superoxide dismutase